MNSFTKWASVAALTLVTVTAQARYVVADYLGKGKDPSKNTHVIVAANGTDQGLQFHMSAAAQARKIMDVNPNDQVILIAVIGSTEGDGDNEKILRSHLKVHNWPNVQAAMTVWGFGQYASYDEDLDTKSLVAQVSKFRVASLNIYSHSTTFYGLIMDGPFNRVDAHSDLSTLKRNFIPGAYAWFHGCNTGLKIIRELTKQWGIPVTGAYTGTAFQQLFKDNTTDGVNFYHTYDGVAPKVQNAKGEMKVLPVYGANKTSYKKSQLCDKVPCVRMMPDNVPYKGWWGSYKEGGLGFYRTSCSSESVPKDVCYAGMARGLINQVNNVYTDLTTDITAFKKAAQDHLCPRGFLPNRIQAGYSYETCAADLEASLTNPNIAIDPFKGKSLLCELNGDCHVSWKCSESALTSAMGIRYLQKDSCSITNKKNPSAPNKTMVDEYAKYVKGFEILQRSVKR